YPTFQSLYTQRKNHASYAHEGNSEIIPPKELRKYEYHRLASFFKRDGYGNFPGRVNFFLRWS
ncbi:unnamed protein product, partial [Allacma fusca]